MSGPWEDFGGTSAPATSQAAAEGPWQEYISGPTQGTYLDDAQFNKELGDRVYRGDSLENIKKWSADNGRDPARLQGLEAAVKYKARKLPGRSSVDTQHDVVKPPEYDAGHGAFGAGVDGALHSIPYVDEIGGALDAVVPTGQGLSAWETGKGFGEQMGANIDQNRAMAEYDWNNHPYAYGTGMVAGTVGGAVTGGALVRAAGALPGVAGRAATTLGANTAGMNSTRAALAGALYGSDVDNGSLGDRASGAGLGAAGGLVGDRVFRGLGRVAQPLVSPTIQTMREAGIRLTPGQLGGKVGRVAEALAERIPFVGNQVRNAQRNSFEDFNKAMINRSIGPGETLIDGSSGRMPGAIIGGRPAGFNAHVNETGQSQMGTVMREGQDWLEAARTALDKNKPTPRPAIADNGDAVFSTADNDLFDGLTQSRIGLDKTGYDQGSYPDEVIGSFIDHHILFQRPTTAMTTEDTGRILTAIRAKVREVNNDGLMDDRERRSLASKFGDLEDLFDSKEREILSRSPAAPPTREELLRQPIGSPREPEYNKLARNNLGRVEDAAEMALDNNQVFTPQEFLDSTRHFKVPQGENTPYDLASKANTVLRGNVPSKVNGYGQQDLITQGGLLGAAAYMLHPGSLGATAAGNLLYSQSGRRVADAILAGNRGRIGDGLSAGFRGAANIAPQVAGMSARSGLSPRVTNMFYKDDDNITPLGD